MKRFIFFILVMFFFTGCVSSSVSFSDSSIFMLKDVFKDSGFFLYAPSDVVSVSDNSVLIKRGDCTVNLSSKIDNLSFVKNLDVKNRDYGSILFSSGFLDDFLVYYAAKINNSDYSFSIYNKDAGVSKCISFVDDLAASFSIENLYKNDLYSFSLPFLDDFVVDKFYKNGFSMVYDGSDLVGSLDNSEVEALDESIPVKISVSADSNSLDIYDYVYGLYEGYSVEFKTLGKWPVAFVDEVSDGFAKRHCFVFVDNFVYSFLLEVSSDRYSDYKKIFDDFCFSLKSI